MSARTLTIGLAALPLVACIRWGEPLDVGDSTSSEDSDSLSTTQAPTETESGGETETTGEQPDYPWPDPLPIDPDARIVVWGKTGIPTRNLDMVANIFLYLSEPGEGGDGDGDMTGDGDGDMTTGDGDGDGDMTGDGDGDGDMTGDGDGDGDMTGDGDGDPGPANGITILWIGDCDPRTDELGCLAGNIMPFFTMVETLGTIEFTTLASVDPTAYDAVIADFCGPITAEQVGLMLGDGAHVLVLGDEWCVREGQTSAELANEILERLGARFNGELLYNHNFLVSDAKQSGLLEGVTTIDAWGLSLQQHDESRFVGPVSVLGGPLLGYRDGGTP